MSSVKVGIIGIGNMGKSHALQLDKGYIEGAILKAVCGRQEQMDWVTKNLSGHVQCYQDEDAFFNESDIDAVIIATPHSIG